MLEIATGKTETLSTDISATQACWLGDDYAVVWLKQTENGNTSLVIADAAQPGKSYTAGTVSGPISDLKVFATEPGTVTIAVFGQANPDGSLFNEKDQPKSHSSAKLYDSLFVRHWDKYIIPQRNSIFTAELKKSPSHVMGRQGMYHLVGFKNALQGTGIECPIPPFGGTDNFDIGRKGLALVGKDPDLDPAIHTKCVCYFLPQGDVMDLSPPQPVKLTFEGLEGAASCPVFSPDGSSIAVLQQRRDGYESDRNLICFYHELDERSSLREFPRREFRSSVFYENEDSLPWDRSPNKLMWALDGKSIFLTAEDVGCNCLFEIHLDRPDIAPMKLTTRGNITSIERAAWDSPLIFVSGDSLVDYSTYMIVDPQAPVKATEIVPLVRNEAGLGLSRSQVESLWFKGATHEYVHAWMVKPSFFKKGQKYPLAYFIHGGPQGAWLDQWSTRWNPAVFAEQGYIVICPNFTGSTGYGQRFTDAIRNEWGGLPYEDLVKGFEHIERNLSDFVDTDRAVALGASYGGYMINWINGHDLGRKFKALVCHDGVFSMTGQLTTEELYFPLHEFSGPLWDRQAIYDKWDPSRFAKNWSTPQLVIHSALDFRLPIAEGLAAFNTLQMRGVESLFLTFPDENHWVLKPENSLFWHEVVISWINKFVGLPPLLDADDKNPLDKCVGGRHRRPKE